MKIPRHSEFRKKTIRLNNIDVEIQIRAKMYKSIIFVMILLFSGCTINMGPSQEQVEKKVPAQIEMKQAQSRVNTLHGHKMEKSTGTPDTFILWLAILAFNNE